MTEIARRLREARERAGLTIGDISARTKIKPAFVQAIERGDFDRLPGHFFTRAFLKAYASEVGLSPDDLVRDFDERRAKAEADDLAALAAAAEQKQVKRPSLHHAFQVPIRLPRAATAVFPRISGAWPVVATIGILIVVLSLLDVPHDTSMRESGAVGTSGIAEAASAQPLSGAAAPTPQQLVVDIRPTEAMWVAATADGERVIYRLLEPGEHVVVEAKREVSFRIGNAAAFEYAINGIPGKRLGGPGEVREFQLTPENYRTYRQ